MQTTLKMTISALLLTPCTWASAAQPLSAVQLDLVSAGGAVATAVATAFGNQTVTSTYTLAETRAISGADSAAGATDLPDLSGSSPDLASRLNQVLGEFPAAALLQSALSR